MTDKEIMEMFIQVHKCLSQIMTLPNSQDIPEFYRSTETPELTKLEILINQAANRTSLPSIETELYPR